MEISHWHLGYYKDGNDIEAVGFFEDGKWVVYYDDSHDINLFDETQLRHELYGVVILKVRDYEEAEKKFIEWVESILLPYRIKR
ncbi:MAG TPA: DUF3986 family protein [Candidatus Udaeobacter sp.]|nr:DUF3986 family protein [Candidatus Udaeobacter sp.]